MKATDDLVNCILQSEQPGKWKSLMQALEKSGKYSVSCKIYSHMRLEPYAKVQKPAVLFTTKRKSGIGE